MIILGETRPDQYRDPQIVQKVCAIATALFRQHGVDFANAQRAGGWTNATWLGGGLAVRVSVQPGSQNIRREATLGALLPDEVGFPTALATGVTDGLEWSVARQIPGENLGSLWPQMGWDDRLAALRQLWRKVEQVHSVDPAPAAPYTRPHSPFYAPDPAAARAKLAWLLDQTMVTAGQVRTLETALDRFWQALPTARHALNHGDFTIENALYSGGEVVSLLDFEFARIAPDEIDVTELIKMAFIPPEFPDPLPDPEGTGLEWLRQTVLELALPMINHPGGKDLLLGYAIQLEAWWIEEMLTHPPEDEVLDREQLKQVLAGLAQETHGYLEPVFAAIG